MMYQPNLVQNYPYFL